MKSVCSLQQQNIFQQHEVMSLGHGSHAVNARIALGGGGYNDFEKVHENDRKEGLATLRT